MLVGMNGSDVSVFCILYSRYIRPSLSPPLASGCEGCGVSPHCVGALSVVTAGLILTFPSPFPPYTRLLFTSPLLFLFPLRHELIGFSAQAHPFLKGRLCLLLLTRTYEERTRRHATYGTRIHLSCMRRRCVSPH